MAHAFDPAAEIPPPAQKIGSVHAAKKKGSVPQSIACNQKSAPGQRTVPMATQFQSEQGATCPSLAERAFPRQPGPPIGLTLVFASLPLSPEPPHALMHTQSQ